MKNLHYPFIITLLFIVMNGCKTDSIDACDVNCSKCVIKSSKTYYEKNELSGESSFEYDEYLNMTKSKAIRYSKGAVFSTEVNEYVNIYSDKLLIKTVQRINGIVSTTTLYSYYPNGKVKRTEKINKDNITFSITEVTDFGKYLYSYYRNTPPQSTYELKWTYDGKNNELTYENINDGIKEYSSISEYNSDNSLSKKTENYNYANQKPYSLTSIYTYDLVNRSTEINYQYVPSRFDDYKIVRKTVIENTKVSIIDYLDTNIQYQQITEYNEKKQPIRISNTPNKPLVLEIKEEYAYHSSGKIKQRITTVAGGWIRYISFLYDENGNEISNEFWDSSKKVVQKTLSTYSCVK
jgi:hypothetical protein